MKLLRKFMLWVYSIEPKFLVENSWANESLAGFVGGIVFMLLLHNSVLLTFIIFNLISILYERFVDPNGWSIEDVLSRLPAFTVAIILMKLL